MHFVYDAVSIRPHICEHIPQCVMRNLFLNIMLQKL